MRSISMLLATSALAVVSHAAPITWAVSLAFADGSAATGSFVFDANTASYSSINIVSTTPVIGGDFQFICVSPCTAGASTATRVLFLSESSSNNLTGAPAIALLFGAPLTNAGGIDTIHSGQEGVCADVTCSTPAASPLIPVVAANSFLEAVPEPYSALLIAIGLAILAVRYRIVRVRS